MNMRKLIQGNKRFREQKFKEYKDSYASLIKNGQKPKILFIGCSDSRVVPDMIVDTNPGDMFLLRNIANFVPPYADDDDFHGVSAVIEYAVSVLKVKDIIVCGHSHCGGCAALYEDFDNQKELSHVKKWLELGQNAKNHALKHVKKGAKKSKLLRLTEKISVVHQIENLLTYPQIKKKINKGNLQIHGWHYNIKNGSIDVYNPYTKAYDKMK
jgi:carbonic anhydrase